MPEAFQNLIDKVENTMKFSIEVEEKVPLDQVTNFGEVSCPIVLLNEPHCEKTGLQGFQPGPTQTGLYSHRIWLED